MKTDHISRWAASYEMRAATVDGNDVAAVSAAATDAVAYVRRERKPFLLETYTYRLRGHMEPDTQGYVDPAELASWKARDPIAAYERHLLANGELTRGELEAMRARVRARVEEAAEYALSSPYPDFAQLTTNVYA